jgi:hypothetical protein
MLYIPPAEPGEALTDTFVCLLIHYKKCGLADCDVCERFRAIETQLAALFTSQFYACGRALRAPLEKAA